MKITSEWNLKDGDKFAECQTVTKNRKFPTSEFYSSGDTNIREKIIIAPDSRVNIIIQLYCVYCMGTDEELPGLGGFQGCQVRRSHNVYNHRGQNAIRQLHYVLQLNTI